MTEEQLAVARNNISAFAERLSWQPNLEFRLGYIENLKGDI